MWTDLCEIKVVTLIYPNSLFHKKGRGEGRVRQNELKKQIITIKKEQLKNAPNWNKKIGIRERYVKEEEEEEGDLSTSSIGYSMQCGKETIKRHKTYSKGGGKGHMQYIEIVLLHT